MTKRVFAVWIIVVAALLAVHDHARVMTAQVAPIENTPIVYRISFPERSHHVAHVEVTFRNLGPSPLEAFMSRSSPGRYAVHDFAKNVFWVEAFDGSGKALKPNRPNPYQWNVAGHDGTVRLVYKIYGDLVDGTYLGIDSTHAHMNMPATFMFGRGLEDRSIRITFVRPEGSDWRVATQLMPTSDPFTFTAPNLQYFMDSPTEFSNFVLSTFSAPGADGKPVHFRIAAHTDASQSDVDDLARLVERLVREHMSIFGEFPAFEPGHYSFLLDYQPGNAGDGMEHRNSTVITEPAVSPLKTAQGREGLLGTMSHEFFHVWNVERIRPAGLEPFDFTRANITCCLWLAEGFTQYYGTLVRTRAGFGRGVPIGTVANLINSSARHVRSAVEMSEYAPFVDAARSVDPTDASRSYVSYYPHGAAIALGLDLMLREMSGGQRTLDDFMRLLWQRHGRQAGARPGIVLRPYTLQDLRIVLAELTGDRRFADDFFDKYVEGRDIVDYARLLERAGYNLRRTGRQDAGWIGVALQPSTEGLVVGGAGSRGFSATDLVAFNTPAYDAGLEIGDVIKSVNGQPATMEALSNRKPGDRVILTVVHRGGVSSTRSLTFASDPTIQITDLGLAMTPAQRAFREAWLGTKVR